MGKEDYQDRIRAALRKAGKPLAVTEMKIRPLWQAEHYCRLMEERGELVMGRLPRGPGRTYEREQITYALPD